MQSLMSHQLTQHSSCIALPLQIATAAMEISAELLALTEAETAESAHLMSQSWRSGLYKVEVDTVMNEAASGVMGEACEVSYERSAHENFRAR